MPTCPKCGARNPRENTVCRSCGAVLGVESRAAPEKSALTPRPAQGGEERATPPVLPAGEGASPPEAEAERIPLQKALLFGLGAALVCGVLWYLLDSRWVLPPIMAFITGWVVGEALVFGAGRKRVRQLQWISLGLTVLTIVVTRVVLWLTSPAEGRNDFLLYLANWFAADLLTPIFLLLGLWQAYSTPAPRRRPSPRPTAAPTPPGEAGERSGEAATKEVSLRCIRCQSPVTEGEGLIIPGRARGTTAILCPKCVDELEDRFAAETKDVRMERAILFGVGAAAVVGILWYLLEGLARVPLAFLAFIAGWLIAEAIRRGTGGKRGRPLQLLALGLTALAIIAVQVALVIPLRPAADENPTWSAAAEDYVAFQSNRDGNWDIYAMKSDGSSPTNMTSHPATDTAPTWGPENRYIAFISDRDGTPEVYRLDTASADRDTIRLTVNLVPDDSPTWSPDGSRIAFVSGEEGQGEILVMNADGSGMYNLSHNPADDRAPTWSDDGQQIAFQSNRDGNWDIYVQAVAGGEARNLTNHPGADQAPAWSPAGEYIAFVSDRDGNAEIYKVKEDGSAPVNLTHSPAAEGHPAWSAGGSRLVFSTDRDGNLEIYAMDADGTRVSKLTNDATTIPEALFRRVQDVFTLILFLLGLWQAYSTLAPRRLPGRRPQPARSEEEE